MAEYTDENYELASKDASLGVEHVWTNTQCKAYRTLDPRDCQCQLSKDGTK